MTYYYDDGGTTATRSRRRHLAAVLDVNENIVPTVSTAGTASGTTPASTVYNGGKDVASAGSYVVLGTTQTLTEGVAVQALNGNADSIYIGGSGVTSADGIELTPGESIFIITNDVANVFIDSASDGDGVTWVGS